MNIRTTLRLHASNAGLEREGIPEETGRGLGKQIKKVGTQFCITSDGVDKNFGCWPSKEKAEAVKSGKSFITPDIDAGGPGSGRHRSGSSSGKLVYECNNCGHGVYEKDIKRSSSNKDYCPECGNPKNKTQEDRDKELQERYKLNAGGPGSGRHKVSDILEDKGWQRTKDMGDAAIYRHPEKHDKIAVDDRYETWSHGQHIGSGHKDLVQHLGSLTAVSYGKYGVKPTVKSPYKKSTTSGPKPISIKAPKLTLGPNLGHPMANPGIAKINADQGEPLAGMYQHANFDTNLWFHPPSLKKPTKVPVDNPGNKDNRFLDVTKRNSKDTQEQRMKLLKRQSPGPNVPVRTTLISPNLNSYMPMNAAAVNPRFKVRPRADLQNAVMRRAFGSAKI